MVVGIKDSAKLTGISIITCCAVFVCTMFLNFYMDAVNIKSQITSEQAMVFYNAQVSTAKVVCAVSGGCLLVTSVIMLIFYIKHYIDTHKRELGILKAMGYSNLSIGKHFCVFGISVFIGTAVGFTGAFLVMPEFYNVQNEKKLLPDMAVNFHGELLCFMVILPTLIFAALAVLYACIKLKSPVLTLLKDSKKDENTKISKREKKDSQETSFVYDLKKSVLKSRKTLCFFIVFASFCFSAMTQMSASMKDLSSVMMGAMMLIIGVVLACTTLFIAITTVIKGNTKTMAIMQAFGYSERECSMAILGCYRPLAYMGFAIGTVYQYVLLKIMVSIVFRDIEGVPDYEFDFSGMLISLGCFMVIYELVMYRYSAKIKNISVKEIFLE